MSDNERLNAALDYAARGWAVMPVYAIKELPDGRVVCRCKEGVLCKAPGKHAVETGWQAVENRTGQDIYPWWDEGAPDLYNVGIRTGSVSGIFVIDVDPGRDGYASLDTLLSRGEVAPTRIHKTGSGGIHLIYRLPEGLVVPNSASRLGPGIDIRGRNGYVVAPPSSSLKGPYAVVEDSGEVMDAPAGLIALVEKLAREKAAGVEVDAVLADPTFDIALIPPDILSILGEVEVADRSAVFHNFVGQAMRAGFTQAQVATAVTPWCQVTGKYYEHGRDRVAQGVAMSWAAIESERSRLELDMPDWFHEAMAQRRKQAGTPSPSHAPDVDAFLRVREGRSLAQIDWAELWKAKFAPDWLVPNLFEVGRNYSVYGGPGTGKSLLMFDFCCQLASGRMLGPDGNPMPPMPIAYFDRENTPADLYLRATSMLYDSADLDNLHYFLYPNVALNVRAGAADFVRHVVDCGARLVVIDTLSRFIEGVKENEAEWVTDFFNYAVVPLKERGITFVRLDHTGKDQSGGARGTSAKLGDVDGAWLLSLDEKSQIIDLQREKTRSGIGPDHVQFWRTREPTSHIVRWVSTEPGQGAPEGDAEVHNTPGDAPAVEVAWVPWKGEIRPVLQPLGEVAGRMVDTLDELFGEVQASQPRARTALKEAGLKPGKSQILAEAVRWRNARIDAYRTGDRPRDSPGDRPFSAEGDRGIGDRAGDSFWWSDPD